MREPYRYKQVILTDDSDGGGAGADARHGGRGASLALVGAVILQPDVHDLKVPLPCTRTHRATTTFPVNTRQYQQHSPGHTAITTLP